MTAVDVIERALDAGILIESLTYVPQRGATEGELAKVAGDLRRPLSEGHANILRRWNGINLDVLRVHGASPSPGEIQGLAEVQSGPLADVHGTVVFGDDSSGFVYGETESGEVMSLDLASGQIKKIAASIDDFFVRLVFGKDAAEFAGECWLDELKGAGIC